MSLVSTFEFLSYVVTVFGFPFAIIIFAYEQRKQRQTDEEELHLQLSDDYTDFLKLVLENSDLQLLRKDNNSSYELNSEQKERRFAIFGILIAIFERAYLLVYEEKMSKQTTRLWKSWEDFMGEWCRRKDFRSELPRLLEGEDDEFASHLVKVMERTPPS